jgi:plasmid maintenance system killer protein
MFNKKKNNDRDIFPIFHKLKIISNSLNSEKSLKNSYFSHAHFLQSTEQKKYFNQQNSNLNENNENELTGNSSLRLNGYSKIQELKLVKIGLASAEQIRQWAEKRLPNGKVFGEVLNANTLHYKTFKPHKGGLFCERIFGPLKDFECSKFNQYTKIKTNLLSSL